MEEYRYDVAFSFLDEDKSLVSQVNELLTDRLETFVYFKRQDELVGNDGEEKFSQVFGEDARIVVIFYRKTWGSKSFTRIEKTAIKNRAFRGDDHYNFILLVNLEDTSPEISWIPVTNIYFSLKQYGVEALAATIENIVIQNGGKVHEETPIELAARIERRRDAEQMRKKFLDSDEGVNVANNEFRSLCEIIKNIIESISNNLNLYKSNIQFINNDLLKVECCALAFYCHWSLRARNTLRESVLIITISNSPSYYSSIDTHKEIQNEYYLFDRNLFEQIGWRKKKDNNNFYSSQQLAEICVKSFINIIDNEIAKREKQYGN